MSLVFRMQVGVSLTALALGVGMLACGKDPAIYLPVVTSILGLWLPVPSQPASSASLHSSSSVGSPEAGWDEEHNDGDNDGDNDGGDNALDNDGGDSALDYNSDIGSDNDGDDDSESVLSVLDAQTIVSTATASPPPSPLASPPPSPFASPPPSPLASPPPLPLASPPALSPASSTTALL